MEYTYLGRTGLKVSRFCLGTMNFGTSTSEKDAFYIMDKAVDAGINFLIRPTPTAGFADEGEHGLTEDNRKVVCPGRQKEGERVILATKVSATMEDPLEGRMTKTACRPGKSAGIWKTR